MDTHNSRLAHLPIAVFPMVMGVCGLAIAISYFGHLFLPDRGLGIPPMLISLGIFTALAIAYAIKAWRYWPLVLAEFRHPISINFFPTIAIGMLLLSSATLKEAPQLSAALWYVAAPLHLVLTLVVMSVWIRHDKFEIQHMAPTWFMPVVGNILVPIAGVHHAPAEISWFFFSIGVLFWPVLLSINFYRFLFHPSLPDKMLPALFILVAPPASGFIAYVALTQQLDGFGRFLYYSAVFTVMLLLMQFMRFIKLRFSLSWWAYSFPNAAFTIATMTMYEYTGLAFYKWASFVLLALLAALITLLLYLTVKAYEDKKICVPEG